MYLDNIVKILPSRIVSAIIDQITLVISFMIFSIGKELASAPEEIHKIKVTSAIILFSLFLNKDLYLGRSIGKYFNGLRVVSSRIGNPASPIQCLIRNIFLFLWPIEALILVFSPQKRIGDVVAGTKVQASIEVNTGSRWQYIQAILSVIIAFVITYFLFNFIDSFEIMN